MHMPGAEQRKFFSKKIGIYNSVSSPPHNDFQITWIRDQWLFTKQAVRWIDEAFRDIKMFLQSYIFVQTISQASISGEWSLMIRYTDSPVRYKSSY